MEWEGCILTGPLITIALYPFFSFIRSESEISIHSGVGVRRKEQRRGGKADISDVSLLPCLYSCLPVFLLSCCSVVVLELH